MEPHKKRDYYNFTALELTKLMVEYQFGTPLHILSSKYGISKRAIKHLASTRDWGALGGRRDEFIAKASKSLTEEIGVTYLEIVKETNDRQLKLFRSNTTLAIGLMNDMNERVKVIREENARRIANTPDGKMPQLLSTAKEAYTLNHICDILRKSMIEGERYILGIKDGIINVDDPNKGAREITRVLEEARTTYGK